MGESFGLKAARILPPETLATIEQARKAAEATGVPVFLVGGLVRDVLLDRPSRDVDLMAAGDVERLAEALAGGLGAPAAASAFGTYRFATDSGVNVDLATARRETYSRPGALPEVAPGSTQDDLERRDFTVNAMAVPVDDDELLDPLGGARDLRSRLLRVLHPRSFIDDPTRVLRGIDLAVRLGFEFEARTAAWAREAMAGGALDTLSSTRLRRALRKMLAAEPAVKLSLAETLGVVSALHPGLRVEAGHDGESLAAVVDPLTHLRIAAGGRREVAGAIASRLGLPPGERERWASFGQRVSALSARAGALLAGPPSELLEALKPFDGLELDLVERLPGTGAGAVVARYRSEVAPIVLRIRGEHLVAAGWREGPAIGRALARTLRARVDGEIEAAEEFEYACSQLRSEA